jgi:hypothetical protein
MFYPTVDLPPDSFGTRENPQSDKLVDPKTNVPRTATILLAYFTTTGSKVDFIGKSEVTQLDFSPFR